MALINVSLKDLDQKTVDKLVSGIGDLMRNELPAVITGSLPTVLDAALKNRTVELNITLRFRENKGEVDSGVVETK